MDGKKEIKSEERRRKQKGKARRMKEPTPPLKKKETKKELNGVEWTEGYYLQLLYKGCACAVRGVGRMEVWMDRRMD